MEENEGPGYIFGLSTVLLGLCFIMSMGVFSVYHPYKPGILKLFFSNIENSLIICPYKIKIHNNIGQFFVYRNMETVETLSNNNVTK